MFVMPKLPEPDPGPFPPVVVMLSARRNARKYQVIYYDDGRPRCVSVKTSPHSLVWTAIWNSDYPLEGKALEAVRAAAHAK